MIRPHRLRVFLRALFLSFLILHPSAFTLVSVLGPQPSVLAEAADAARETDVDAVVAKLQGRYDSTKDFTAKVNHEMEITSLGRTVSASGMVYFKRPGRMRWELKGNQSQTIVADGQTLWIYQPDEKQVYKAPFSQAFQSTTPVSFLIGIGRIADDFQATLDGETDTLVYLRLLPRTGAEIGVLRLGLDRNTFDILEADVRDPLGNVTRLRFSEIKRDAGLDDDLFKFNVPAGAEVVEAPKMAQ